MFDTVHLVGAAPDGYLAVMDRVADRLDGAVAVTEVGTGEILRYRGRCEGLKVSVSACRLNIRGSLARFLRAVGWEGDHPTLDDVRAARSILEHRLGVELASASVWRLDVFSDLRLSAPVSRYLNCLVAKPRFQRSSYEGTSVSFGVKRRQLLFYDKAAERRSKAPDELHPLLDSLADTEGLLRYELRLLSRLSEQMGAPVTFEDLHDPVVWLACVTRWESEYKSVATYGGLHAPRGPFKPRDHMTLLAALVEGPGKLIDFYRAELKKGRVTKSQYRTARASILRVIQDPTFAAPSEYVDELDAAVAGAAERMRAAGRT